MDENSDNDVTPGGWSVSDASFQPATPDFVSSTTSTYQGAQGELPQLVQGTLSEAQLQALTQVARSSGLHVVQSPELQLVAGSADLGVAGPSGLGVPGPSGLQQQQIYQAVTSSYQRLSPDVEYPSSATGAADTLQFRTLSPEGAQILRMANADGRGLQQGFVTVLLGSHSQQFSQLTPVSRALASSLSVVGEHQHIQLGEHSVALSLDREHPVSQASHAPLLHVVSSLPQLSHVESTTNEASPLATPDTDHVVSSLELAFQKVGHQEDKQDLESYSNEPDTTQEDLKPSFDPMAHDGAYDETAARHLHLTAGSHANGLEASMNAAVVNQQLEVGSRQHDRHTWNVLETVGQQLSVVVQSHLDGGHLDDDVHGHMEGAGHIDARVREALDAQVGGHLLPPGLSHAAALHMESNMATNGLTQQQLDVNSSDLAQVLVTAGPSGLQISTGDQIHTVEDLPGASALELDGNTAEYFHNGDGYREVRKSERIAQLERPPSPVVRPEYYPKEYYNTEELWCEDCQTMFLGGCPKHTLSEVYDKVVLSRAWASLPPILQIFRMGDTSELGVFAKKGIAKRTQFGPFIGDMVDSKDKLANQNFVLQVERAGGHIGYFEATDENKCNWMMFVRPAENWGEQNLVAYQYGIDIYFCTVKNIEPRQELKVWYAAPYALRIGAHLHKLNDADIEGLADGDNRWPCYDCNKRFRTSAQLQKHLIIHETRNAPNSDDERKGKRKSTASCSKSKRLAVGKESMDLSQDDSNSSSSSAFQNWKKKKATNIFLNKFNKYRRDTVKKSIKSLYKKKGKASGGQEWVCLHCDLTFDNASLLNLHTLTHAAEDIGLQEIQKRASDSAMVDLLGNGDEGMMSATGDALLMYAVPLPVDSHLGNPGLVDGAQNHKLPCPVCNQVFVSKRELVEHAAEHGKRKPPSGNPLKPHKCGKCWKAFSSAERLTKHMLCHGDERSKPLQCNVCLKRFMNNSALACHIKTHSDQKYYDCPICKQGFDQVSALKEHVVKHAVNGLYTCPECHRSFQEYNLIRKHMRAFHSDKKFPCPQCPKVFPRHDKLKLHMLKHTSIREFMCETCGRQFKRKDKLKEHTKRMHCPGRPKPGDLVEQNTAEGNNKKFVPKVAPTDYQRFIYKCHTCLLGFKRRGMLVNHLAKRHPEISPDLVPELNLPILKTQHDYYCQYCDKVYKSTSKRKAHILKNHPGAALPTVNRSNSGEIFAALPNSNFSSPVGSVTTVPHPCQFCHKQYASKAKLMQHQRKEHGAAAAASAAAQRRQQQPAQQPPQQQMLALAKGQALVMTPMTVDSQERLVEVSDPMQADLLTQAMSELTQTLEFRATPMGELPLGRLGTTATVLQAGNQSSIELGQLTPTLIHTHFPQQSTVTSAATGSAPATSMATMLAASLPGEHVPVSTVSLAPSTATFLPKGWTTTTVASFTNLR